MPRLGISNTIVSSVQHLKAAAPSLAAAPNVTNGYSLAFDGSGDSLKIDSDASIDNFLSGGGTLSVWYTMEGAGQNNYGKLITKDGSSDGFGFNHTGGRKISYVFHNTNTTYTSGTCDTAHTYSTSDWHHIAVGCDSDDLATVHPTIFIDGTKLIAGDGITVSTHATDGLGIGSYDDSGKHVFVGDYHALNRCWNGNIDEISFWTRELSDAEVASLYNSGTPTDLEGIDGLVGWWRMEENTGSTVADSSENSNTGAITNASWSSDTA